MLLLKVILLFLISVECRNVPRRYGLKREPNLRAGRRHRGEVFEDLFNVFDPSFLGVVWPKISNGVHVLVDHACWGDVSVFLRDLVEGKSWAVNVADASGRYGSSMFDGNRFWLGSKEQCLRLDKESLDKSLNMTMEHSFENDIHDWRVVHSQEMMRRLMMEDQSPPHSLAYTVLNVNLNITKTNMIKSYEIALGVCLPRSCSSNDLKSIINFSIIINDNLKANRTIQRNAKITDARRIQDAYDINTDAGAISLVCITTILGILVLVATAMDLNLTECLPFQKKSMTFDLEKYKTNINQTRKKINGPDMYKDSKENATYDNIKQENEKIEQTDLERANKDYRVVEKMLKCGPPTITLDVNCVDRTASSCTRCGKYRKQCRNPKQFENLPPCPRIKSSSTTSLSTNSSKRNVLPRLLLCFSLDHCWRRVFNTNTASKDLALVHAMRIVSTLWFIFVHVAVVSDYLSGHVREINEHNNVYFILVTGTIAFDTLLFISGLFSAHHFFFLNRQYSIEELVGFRGVCGNVLQFVCFVVNRIIRLLPSYAYVVLLSAVLSRISNKTAVISLPESDDRNCGTYWWRNLLYISSFYSSKEQCMQVSWYLSTETQLHMIAVLLCAASVSSTVRARISITLAFGGVLAATVTDASAAYFEYERYTDAFAAYRNIIDRPWARVAPYFIGVFLGWLIHIMRGKLKVSKVTSSLLWATACSFTFASWTVPWVGLPWVAAWLHLTWPIALMWPVLICSTNFSGVFRRLVTSPVIAGLSRLCYGMILLHGPISRFVLLSLDSALCSHTLCIWLYFAGTTFLTVLGSLALALLVEMPCCSLLRRLSDCATT